MYENRILKRDACNEVNRLTRATAWVKTEWYNDYLKQKNAGKC
jgi:hypothetical protein